MEGLFIILGIVFLIGVFFWLIDGPRFEINKLIMSSKFIGFMFIFLGIMFILTGLVLMEKNCRDSGLVPVVISSNSSNATVNKSPVPLENKQPKQESYTIKVSPRQVNYTGIKINASDLIVITASGKINSMPESMNYDGTYKWVGPNGWGNLNPGFISEGTKSLAGPLPQGRSYMALTARIATSQPSLTDGNWILVGKYFQFKSQQDGMLYFVVNEKIQENGKIRMDWLENNQGEFTVKVTIKR